MVKRIIYLIFALSITSSGFGQIDADGHNINAERYYRSGSEKFKTADYRGAIVDYSKAIEIDPKQVRYYLDRALVKDQYLKDYRGAIDDYTKVIELDDQKKASPYFLRGMAKIRIQQKDSGCLDLSKAGELGYSQAYDAIKEYCQ